MIAPEPGTKTDSLILDYQNKQLLCIGVDSDIQNGISHS